MGCLLSPESSDLDLYRETVLKTADAIIASIKDGKAYAGPEPRALNKIISSYEILPQHGSGFDSVLADLKKTYCRIFCALFPLATWPTCTAQPFLNPLPMNL